MYDYEHQDLFYVDGTNKQYLVICEADEEGDEPITISNEDMEDNSFEINEAITDSESLSFSNCISSYVKFVTYNMEQQLIDHLIMVYQIIDYDTENPIPIGSYTVKADNISTDGKSRQIVAYDDMYDIINSDVTEWYNSLQFPISVKDFRDSFFYEFDIEQDNEALVNDDIMLPRQLNEEDLISGDAIVKAICDINGVFCHIGKDGLLHWITLDTGDIYEIPLYPGFYPGENAYPGIGYQGVIQDIYKNYYQENSVIWANYATEKIDGVQIRNELNEIAYQTDELSVNPYIVISNFLCYSLDYGQYQQIANRLFEHIKDIVYVPFQITKMGDPCMEVGDRVLVYTQNNLVFSSYIFSKRSKGILVPFEGITTSGTLYLSQYDIGGIKQATEKKLRNLDQRVGNIEKSGSGPLQIRSVAVLPESPQLNILYLIQGEVQVD